MKQQRFSISNRVRSFKHALNGIRILFLEEHNARIHLFAILCVIVSGIFFRVSILEWISILLAVGLVFSLELINTTIENLADFVSPDYHDKIKKIKDLSAAAVLVAAVVAFIIGLLIFAPKIYTLIWE